MSNKANKILDYFGKAHSGFIHARGRASTQKIIELLNCQPGEKILEIGFGTGTTLALLAALHPRTSFYGYEQSAIMFQTARRRLQFSGLLRNTELSLLEKEQPIARQDSEFDKIYLESVLAIQEENKLQKTLANIKMLLKPGGELIFNETIWLDTTSKEVAQSINETCKSSFGIIQANHTYLHLSHWKKLLNSLGFAVSEQYRVDDLQNNPRFFSQNRQAALSELFSLTGKVKSKLNGRMRKEWTDYQNKMDSLFEGHGRVMEGIILKATTER